MRIVFPIGHWFITAAHTPYCHVTAKRSTPPVSSRDYSHLLRNNSQQTNSGSRKPSVYHACMLPSVPTTRFRVNCLPSATREPYNTLLSYNPPEGIFSSPGIIEKRQNGMIASYHARRATAVAHCLSLVFEFHAFPSLFHPCIVNITGYGGDF